MMFLITLALIWIIAASIQDIKKREVPNWLNFSLVAVALSYRAIKSLIEADPVFFWQGLIGFAIFFVLGYVFYYGKVFAGGDAKLLIALGPVLPFSTIFAINVSIFLVFIFLLLVSGSVYGLLYSMVLTVKNRKRFAKEFKKQAKGNKGFFYTCIIFFIIVFVFFVYFQEVLLLILGILFLILPFLYTYARSIEESCMVKQISSKDLVEGDWLYTKIKVGNKVIEPNWQGLTVKQVKLLKKTKRKIWVKEGIPFVPAFLFAFIILLILWNYSIGFFDLFYLF